LTQASQRSGLSEGEQLRALVLQAWELRETPYAVDACRAIVDWNQRRPLARLERDQEDQARARRVIASTDRLLAALDVLNARRAPA
jgi:hypothetical protein